MSFQTLFDCLGNWCRRALHCLHWFFWVCIWPSRGGFSFLLHFMGIYPGFVRNAGGFECNWFGCPRVLELGSQIFEDKPHLMGFIFEAGSWNVFY